MNLDSISCIADLEQQAKKRLPKMFFEYIEQGSFKQSTLQKNKDDFNKYPLKQAAFVDTSKKTTNTSIFGEQYSLPFGFGPTGLMGLFWPDAEMHALKICQENDIPFCLSTMSICSLDDVAKVAKKPFWFQLYLFKDKKLLKKLMQRAKDVGVSTLFVNADLPTTGIRYCDIRNGMTVPPRLTVKSIFNIAQHQSWVWRYLFSKRKSFGNLAGLLDDATDIKAITRYMNAQYDSSVTWDDIQYLRDQWSGNLVIKGVSTVEAIQNAEMIGANGVVVSNHGGRQLDGVVSSIQALDSITREQKETKLTIMFDGGIRYGQDVFRSLALGANSVLLGRALLYGMAAYGPKGLSKAIEIMKNELDSVMTLTGTNSIKSMSRSTLNEHFIAALKVC